MTLSQTLQRLATQVIGHRVQAVTASRSSLEDFASPTGDPGLFVPDSMAWGVHEHFTAMMVGGFSSLMVQALNPSALAACCNSKALLTRPASGRAQPSRQDHHNNMNSHE